MELTIEPVKDSEIEALQSISIKTFYDTFHAQNTKEDITLFLTSTFNLPALQSELADVDNQFFFAKVRQEMVGYLKLSTKEKPKELSEDETLEIARIYTIKEKIGQGIGKVMIDFAISYAKNNHKKTLWLGVWEHNQRAIKFYERLGFKKFSQHIFLVGHDPQTDWLMQLKIDG